MYTLYQAFKQWTHSSSTLLQTMLPVYVQKTVHFTVHLQKEISSPTLQILRRGRYTTSPTTLAAGDAAAAAAHQTVGQEDDPEGQDDIDKTCG